MPPSRTVAPYSQPGRPVASRRPLGHGRHPRHFIPVTNPLERFNREIARRTDVVGIFPDDPSLIRLVSMLAIEANDEWLVGRGYISQRSMAALWDRRPEPDIPSIRKGGRAARGGLTRRHQPTT
jgi:hypothetical protein